MIEFIICFLAVMVIRHILLQEKVWFHQQQIEWLLKEVKRLDADIDELYSDGPDPDDGEPIIERLDTNVVAFRKTA